MASNGLNGVHGKGLPLLHGGDPMHLASANFSAKNLNQGTWNCQLKLNWKVASSLHFHFILACSNFTSGATFFSDRFFSCGEFWSFRIPLWVWIWICWAPRSFGLVSMNSSCFFGCLHFSLVNKWRFETMMEFLGPRIMNLRTPSTG